MNANRGLVHRDTPISSTDDKRKEPPLSFLLGCRGAELSGLDLAKSIDSDKLEDDYYYRGDGCQGKRPTLAEREPSATESADQSLGD